MLLIVSCSNEAENKTDDTSEEAETESSGNNKGTETKVYTLPAPLQMVSAIKLYKPEYSANVLGSEKEIKTVFSSSYARALALGIYTIDLGYTTVYAQHPVSMIYLKSIQSISQDLGVSSGIQPQMYKRFKENKDNEDSLCHIILESYRDAHTYFQNNKREDVAMFIVAGGYIEGLYLTLSAKNDKNLWPYYPNLVGQQKIYLQNIIEIIDFYNKNRSTEVNDLLADLRELYKVYDEIKVEYKTTGDTDIVDCDVTSAKAARLLNKVKMLRDSILNA